MRVCYEALRRKVKSWLANGARRPVPPGKTGNTPVGRTSVPAVEGPGRCHGLPAAGETFFDTMFPEQL